MQLYQRVLTQKSEFALAYGVETVSASTTAAIRTGNVSGLNRVAAPVAVIGRECATLRMSDHVPLLTRQAVASDLAHAASQVRLLEDHVISLCGSWAKPRTAFVAGYFTAVRTHVEAQADRIAANTGALFGLVEPMHWAFAAPLPLPRAHILLETNADDTERVDIAFWCLGQLVICSLGGGTLTPSARARKARLKQAGARFVQLDRANIDDPVTLLDRMGPGFRNFLDGIELPASPFRGSSIALPTPTVS